MKVYLGIDIGSVSTNLVIIDKEGGVRDALYLKTQGNPIGVLQQGLLKLSENWSDNSIAGVGVTGSGRRLAGVMVGADVIKNE
ncbi:MAG: 2-hydroxyglutaryl-CoA dehydratase, partial [bacterium]